MAKEFARSQRVGDLIQRELASLLEREIPPREFGLVTVSGVEVSRDLAYATVFVTALGEGADDPRAVVGYLNQAAGHLRHELARRLVLRSLPRLRFAFDASVSEGARLSDLIDKAVASDRLKEQDDDG